VRPRLACVGGPRLAHGRDQPHPCEPVVAQRQQAGETSKHRHPDEDCALRPQREQTLRRRLPALCCAPWLGIECLSGCATPAHPLETRVGRGSHRATRGQLLGHLERLGAAAVLIPGLSADQVGQRIDGEGHLRASGSRRPRHQGQSTMRGRLMAGSHAVMAHDDPGRAVCVASDAPALPLSQIIVADGQPVAEATGSAVVVIDRAGNSGALAEAFAAQGLGVLGLLEDNEPAGLERLEAPAVATLEDGTRVESGPWQESRTGDPRHLVLVQPAAGTTWVSWGTPQVQDALEAQAWPGGLPGAPRETRAPLHGHE
jgi:hypothetical protein